MFIRKVYYDLDTGDILESHMRKGAVAYTSFDYDLAIYPSLAGRSKEDTGCIEWLEEDAEIEESFRNATSIRVENGEVLFDFTPKPKPLNADEIIADLQRQLAEKEQEIAILKKQGAVKD